MNKAHENRVSPTQLQNMQHAVGFFHESPGYRNGYCIHVNNCDRWEDLCNQGLAQRGADINNGRDRHYHVTDAGKLFLGLYDQVELMRRLTQSKRRTQMYYLQVLLDCGAFTSDDIEAHGFSEKEIQAFDPTDC